MSEEILYDPRKSWTQNLELKSGDLSRYGYSAYASTRTKIKALTKALRKYGYAPVIRKLNVLANLSVNKPKLHRIYRKDLKLAQQLGQKLKIADPIPVIVAFDPIRPQEVETSDREKSNRVAPWRSHVQDAVGEGSPLRFRSPAS